MKNKLYKGYIRLNISIVYVRTFIAKCYLKQILFIYFDVYTNEATKRKLNNIMHEYAFLIYSRYYSYFVKEINKMLSDNISK